MTLASTLRSLRMAKPSPLPSRPSSRQQWRPSEFLDRHSSHYGHGLTIAKIQSAYRSAEQGHPCDQCDMFDDKIEIDGHLRAALEWRSQSVSRQTWIIQPGGKDPQDIEAARMLDETLHDVPNFVQTLEHQTKFAWYGWAATEIEWQRVDGATRPVWFENVIPQRFRFDARDRPLLILGDTDQVAPLRPGKWWYTCGTGRMAATSGLMRTAAFWSHFKSLSASDWMIYQNRYGLPYIMGKYLESNDEDAKADLKTACRDVGTDGYTVLPEGCEIEVIQPTDQGQGARTAFADVIETCNAEISKLVTGATLTADQGSGPGSHALGKVHQGRSFSLIQGDANRLSESFEQQIGKPFVQYNGLNAKPPRLKIHLQLNVSVLEHLEIMSKAANELGVAIDENQLRQIALLIPPTGEPLVGTKTAKPGPDESEDPPEE